MDSAAVDTATAEAAPRLPPPPLSLVPPAFAACALPTACASNPAFHAFEHIGAAQGCGFDQDLRSASADFYEPRGSLNGRGFGGQSLHSPAARAFPARGPLPAGAMAWPPPPPGCIPPDPKAWSAERGIGPQGGKKDKDKACTVFVGNIAYTAVEAEVRELLVTVGLVQDFRLARDRGRKEHKGFGFCDFVDVASAEAAVEVLHNRELHGRRIRVTKSDKCEESLEGATTAMASNFPPEWANLDAEELCRLITTDLEIFAPLACPLELLHCGTRALAEFADAYVASQTVEALAGGVFTLEMKPPSVVAQARRQKGGEQIRKTDKRCIVFVGNLSFEMQDEDLRTAFGQVGKVTSVRLVYDKGTKEPKGYGFVEFADQASARRAESELNGTEVCGRKLRVKPAEAALGEERPARWGGGHRRGSQGEDDPDRVILVAVHIDELSMPKRPEVEPSTLDREVWVNPLPDKEDEAEWLRAFGKVEDLFRIPDLETGEVCDRGYVRFASHPAAASCVASGAGFWSESERVLTSQHRHRSYPGSTMELLLGPKGETINALKEHIGVSMLALRGNGVRGPQHQQSWQLQRAKSERLHFVCRGSATAVAELQRTLEEHVSKVHEQLRERLAAGPPPPGHGDAEAHCSPSPQRRQKRRRNGNGQLNPGTSLPASGYAMNTFRGGGARPAPIGWAGAGTSSWSMPQPVRPSCAARLQRGDTTLPARQATWPASAGGSVAAKRRRASEDPPGRQIFEPSSKVL